MHTGKRTILLVLAASAAVGAVVGALTAFTHDLPQIRALESFRPSAVTRLFSRDRVLLAEFYAEKRDPVTLQVIPDHLKKALIATEDRGFYTHSGIDLKGILRAVVRDIRAGGFVEGASTITQQLAKTLFLTAEKTLGRKIKEAILAFQLERRYTKDEILALYLNQVYFGSGAYGVQAAAHQFFGKPVWDLDLSQCALIAAMPKAPSRFSPLVNPGLALQRRDIVLRQMAETGIITENERAAAAAEPVRTPESQSPGHLAPYFVDHVREALEARLGSTALYKGGLTVETTLDHALQEAAEQSVEMGLARLAERMRTQKVDPVEPQCALVCLDVGTGGVLAMVGGADYAASPFNRAVNAHRQPGSAFKPVVYARAVQNGWAQNALILDAPVVYAGAAGGKDWRPENFSGSFAGEMTLRKALALSRNTPAVRLLEALGPEAVALFAQTLGIRSTLSANLSLALGTSETTLLELTSAYAVFPNVGEYVEPNSVVRVLDADGRDVWRNRPRRTVAMSPEAAAVMVDMLRGAVSEGTGKGALAVNRPVAGKTGTTDRYRDALFVGFSPELAAGVWVGQDRAVTLGTGETGARAALPIWTAFMTRALENRPFADFDAPDGMVRLPMDPETGALAAEGRPGAVAALFRKGEGPRENRRF